MIPFKLQTHLYRLRTELTISPYMTNKELIALLSTYPSSATVYQSADAEGNAYMPLDEVVETAPGVLIIYPAHEYVEDEDTLFDEETAHKQLNDLLAST